MCVVNPFRLAQRSSSTTSGGSILGLTSTHPLGSAASCS